MKTLLLFIFVLPVFASAQVGDSKQQMQVMMKMASLRQSLLNKDTATLSRLLADNVTYGHTNGMIQSKGELVQDIANGNQQYQAINLAGLNVTVYNDAATVNLDATIKMIYHGKLLDFKMKALFVWIKQSGEWKLVARQSVKYE
jgi:hypothetical protein